LILLDASALLSFLWGEAGEEEVAALLHDRECATVAPCLSEVVDRLIRRSGVPREDVVDRLEPLIEASLGIFPIENRIAWEAGELRAQYYERKSYDLSLADCTVLAVIGSEDKLATSDGALAKVAQKLGVGVIALPDSRGVRPDLG
jgi:PIN domain nuclease of toxin-antitoxin system